MAKNFFDRMNPSGPQGKTSKSGDKKLGDAIEKNVSEPVNKKITKRNGKTRDK